MPTSSADLRSWPAEMSLGPVSESYHCVSFHSHASRTSEASREVWDSVADALRRRLPAASFSVANRLQGGDRPARPCRPTEQSLQRRRGAAGAAVPVLRQNRVRLAWRRSVPLGRGQHARRLVAVGPTRTSQHPSGHRPRPIKPKCRPSGGGGGEPGRAGLDQAACRA